MVHLSRQAHQITTWRPTHASTLFDLWIPLTVDISIAPINMQPKRATAACFVTGTTALPAEVEAGVPALVAAPVTCTSGVSTYSIAIFHLLIIYIVVDLRDRSSRRFVWRYWLPYHRLPEEYQESSRFCPVWAIHCYISFRFSPLYSETFSTPSNPATADLTTLQNQLNDYLAVEAGVRVRNFYRIFSSFD